MRLALLPAPSITFDKKESKTSPGALSGQVGGTPSGDELNYPFNRELFDVRANIFGVGVRVSLQNAAKL